MNTSELLTATGHIWRVSCYRDQNRRRLDHDVYVRAADILAAERAARAESGRKTVAARPWDPRRESVYGEYIRDVGDDQ